RARRSRRGPGVLGRPHLPPSGQVTHPQRRHPHVVDRLPRRQGAAGEGQPPPQPDGERGGGGGGGDQGRAAPVLPRRDRVSAVAAWTEAPLPRYSRPLAPSQGREVL